MASIIKSSGGIRRSSGIASMSLAGPGLLATTLPGGRVALTATSARAKSGSPAHPWKLTGIIAAGPTAKIRVSPGMVNNSVPTIGGTSLTAFPVPELTVTGASGIIQLKATTTTAGVVTAVIVENVAGPGVTADTSTAKYKLVGTWTASGGGVFTSVVSILNANQTTYPCGAEFIWEA